MVSSILCRSPLAEAALRSALPGRRLSSIGLYPLEGHGIYADSAAVARKRDIPLSDRAARQFTTGIGGDIPVCYWMGAGMHGCAVNMIFDSAVHWGLPLDARLE